MNDELIFQHYSHYGPTSCHHTTNDRGIKIVIKDRDNKKTYIKICTLNSKCYSEIWEIDNVCEISCIRQSHDIVDWHFYCYFNGIIDVYYEPLIPKELYDSDLYQDLLNIEVKK